MLDDCPMIVQALSRFYMTELANPKLDNFNTQSTELFPHSLSITVT